MTDYWIEKGEEFTRHYKSSKFSPSYIVRLFLDKRSEIIRRWVGRGDSILDIGCGGGENLLMLNDKFNRLCGIDISEGMIAEAKKSLLRLEGKNLELAVGSVDRVGYPDKSFDTVMIIGVFDYLPDAIPGLKEARRILKREGIAIVTFPKKPSPFGFLRSKTGNFIKKVIFNLPPILTTLTKVEAENACKSAGFAIIESESVWNTMWIMRLTHE